MVNLRLKRHESFSIRDGWFEKAINTIKDTDENLFYKHDGIRHLGIGSNMVKGLKYWLFACRIIDTSYKLTPFGEFIYKYDRYLEKDVTWYLIHIQLVLNFNDAPSVNCLFNLNLANSFDRLTLLDLMKDYLKDYQFNPDLLNDDLAVVLHSYCREGDISVLPEDNLACPLSNLKFFKKQKNTYYRIPSSYLNLDYRIVYYALVLFNPQKNSFVVDDIIVKPNNPTFILNIEKNLFFQYLEDMQRNGLIKLDRTAGLNTVYFNDVDLERLIGELYA